MARVEDKYFTLTVQQAIDAGPYDVIVVGSGVGGGTVAADFFDTNFKVGEPRAINVLVIEKGDLLFHSHCLNSARPIKDRNRAQDNDVFFQDFRDDYTIETSDPANWNGGPVYCLGGRSTVWGLFSPRIHDRTLHEHFPVQVVEDLKTCYYPMAEAAMTLSIPATNQRHLRLIERLNIDRTVSGRDVSWEWGRIASQFHRPSNYYFPEGAWSTVDRLLQIAMSKPEGKEHPHFRILLRAEVRRIVFKKNSSGQYAARGVEVLAKVDGAEKPELLVIPLRHGAAVQVAEQRRYSIVNYQSKVTPTVILAAGSVESPAILHRSKVSLNDALHITDHEIIHASRSFRYKDESVSKEVGGVKLQTYITNLPSCPKEIFLANIAIDTSSFLPRGQQIRDDSLPQFVMAIIRLSPLLKQNTITFDSNDNPVVHIDRESNDAPTGGIYDELQQVTEAVMETLKQVLDIQILPPAPEAGQNFWERLPLGGVAHELGSIPMPGPDGSSGCVDADLSLRGVKGVRVCDLSVFPISPEVNPTLTLNALALRLSRSMNPTTGSLQSIPGVGIVVNQSGVRIEVQVAEIWRERRWNRIPPFPDHMDPDDFRRIMLRDNTWNDSDDKRTLPRPGDPTSWRWLPSTKEAILEPGEAFAWTRYSDASDWILKPRQRCWTLRIPGGAPEPVMVWRLVGGLAVGPETYVVTPGGKICIIPALTLA